MNLSRVAYFFILLVSILYLTSCGYRFRAEGEPVGIELESIAVPMIESTASTKGFEADFTAVLRNEFISHSRVPIKSKDQAKMILQVQVYEITTQPLTYDSTRSEVSGRRVIHETTSARRLLLKLSANLIDRSTGNTVWSEPSITEEASFDITSDPLVNLKSERVALLKIAKIVSGRLFNMTMERF